ncbi:hypothetical protein [Staphylococcus hominis]|uniref:hypothetical protein n=1 Tax=Staphylococcus hominis TaxID=1290 RepID=UPI0011A640BE|nr:hypothetical protein [Staphylococcus hominis]
MEKWYNKKNNIEKVNFISRVYSSIIFVVFLLLIIGIVTSTYNNDAVKTTLSTLITLIFGTASKSFYNGLIIAPYDFDEESFKKNKQNAKKKSMVNIVVDVLSGIAVSIYLFQFTYISNKLLAYSISTVIAICIIILSLLYFLVIDYKRNK